MTAPGEATLTEGFALLLGEYDLGTYRARGAGGDVFVGGLPRDPAVATGVTLANNATPDAARGYDDLSVIYRVRGEPNDPVGAERRAQAIYDALNGLPRGTPVPETGAVLQRMHAATSGPTYSRRDDQGRHEFTVTFAPAEVRRTTPNRTR